MYRKHRPIATTTVPEERSATVRAPRPRACTDGASQRAERRAEIHAGSPHKRKEKKTILRSRRRPALEDMSRHDGYTGRGAPHVSRNCE